MVRVGELMRGAEGLYESRLPISLVATDMEDLLRLCREVRLSSRGFMSGGSLAILRKTMAR